MTTTPTARHNPDRQARDSNHLWRLLGENLPDTVTLVDREGAILLANWCTTPASPEDEVRDSIYSHLPEGCRQHVRESLEALFQTGRPQYYEVEETAPGAGTIWYSHRMEPVCVDDEIVNAIIITTDITRYKGEEIAARREQRFGESRRLASIAELAAGIGHEVNNPLAVVQGYAEVLLNSDLPEMALSHIQNIHAAAKRSARIVRDLNQLARHSDPTRLPVNLKALMGQVIDLKKLEFTARDMRFTTDFPEDLPFVLVDPYQLMEALLNILNNAQQAVAQTRRDGEVHCKAQVLGRQVRLSISDNGPGIAPENINRVFDPFFTTYAFGNGPGLGLSISYAIVHQNGGELWAESILGKGATFHLQLPIHLPD